MNQSERRQYLIRELLGEDPRFAGICIPGNVDEQKQLLRALMNVRMPKEISREFLMVQDAYLTALQKKKGSWNYQILHQCSLGSICGKGISQD